MRIPAIATSAAIPFASSHENLYPLQHDGVLAFVSRCNVRCTLPRESIPSATVRLDSGRGSTKELQSLTRTHPLCDFIPREEGVKILIGCNLKYTEVEIYPR